MRVAVLIVSYRSVDDIRQCLQAVDGTRYSDFRVIICENGGKAAWEALRAELPPSLSGGQPIELLSQHENLGFAGGVNACLAQATEADAYWILNPDAEPEPTALGEMVARLQQGDCSMVGHDLILPTGRLASRGGGHWARWSALAISIDHGRPMDPRPDPALTERRMNYVVGASMLVSADFIRRIGVMREDYFLYCEEVEWCLRGVAAGERLGYAPDALVLHRHGTSTGGGGAIAQRSRISVYLQERNRLLVTRDMFRSLFLPAAVLSLVHLTARYGKARAWRQLMFAAGGWLAGLRNERGRPAWFELKPGP